MLAHARLFLLYSQFFLITIEIYKLFHIILDFYIVGIRKLKRKAPQKNV